MSDLTPKMKAAIISLSGSPKTCREARIDLRTMKALYEKSLVRSSNGSWKGMFSLTKSGVEVYQSL